MTTLKTAVGQTRGAVVQRDLENKYYITDVNSDSRSESNITDGSLKSEMSLWGEQAM